MKLYDVLSEITKNVILIIYDIFSESEKLLNDYGGI
jgi:hypothetical protein